MGTFLSGFALSYAAALLLVGGAGHVLGLKAFVQVIRSHGLFTSLPAASVVAAAVCGFELVAGGAAAWLLFGGSIAGRTAVLVATACAGGAFAVYLQRLLARPSAHTSCGCSPLHALLTRASLAPSLGLGAVSLVGLVGTALAAADGSQPVAGVLRLLPVLWGVTVSGLTMIYPAAVLHP